MATRWSGRRAVIGCLLAAATLAIGIGAASGAKLKTESATVTVPPNNEARSATATCDQGTKAVSGGYETQGEPEGSNVFLGESQRTARRDWTARVRNAEPTQPVTLTALAYCRDQKVKSFTEGTSLASDEVDTVVASCPAGMKAISGGLEAEFDANTSVIPHASRKVGKREWAVSARNLAPNPGTLTAQVNCHEGKKPKTKEVTENVAGFEETDIVVRCKRKQRVVSGGFASDQPISKGGPYFTASRKRGGRRWELSVLTVANQITAYAYCEKKKQG